MPSPAIRSSLEIANWFFKKSDIDDVHLENSKLHHLLFLSQMHYALTHNMQHLFPAVFICDQDGFQEPNIAHILSFGMPLMNFPKFNNDISSFLNLIWQKYASLSNPELTNIIKSSEIYQNNFNKNKTTIIEHNNICQSLKSFSNKKTAYEPSSKRKVLISQNGPVVVSKWQPRKLSSTSN